MRKQYHLKRINGVLHAWDVDRLVGLSADLPVIQVALDDIAELDEPYWFEKTPTSREIAIHINLCNAADLSYPIILSVSGRLLDGMHRVLKALANDCEYINAVKLESDLLPDYIGLEEDELPY
ncbi:MAG: hypothetical protein LBV43_09515 [Prevotella sp.]|jgi:hypothetical protein|nr:hypothetical protein [Prevotella sp.]